MRRKIRVVLSIISIFVVSLAVGFTTAWFTAGRTATGIIKVGNGIVLDYTNLKEVTVDQTTEYLLLFNDQTINTVGAGSVSNLYPADYVDVKPVTVSLHTGSADAYLRFKIVYSYYYEDTETPENSGYIEVNPGDANYHIATPIGANTNFRLNTTNNYYYYCSASGESSSSFAYTDMKKLSEGSIELFGSNNRLTLANTAPPSYQLQIKLVIEAIQSNSAGFTGMSW